MANRNYNKANKEDDTTKDSFQGNGSNPSETTRNTKGNTTGCAKSKGNGKKPTRKSGKGGRSSYKGDVADRKAKRFEDITSNNINWWNRSSLYPLATSIQYNQKPGYIYDQADLYYTDVNTGYGANGQMRSWPGICKLSYYPTIGVSNSPQSPVNLAFTSLFADLIAHTNSSQVGFEQMDLALTSIATSSPIVLIAEAERVLGLLNVYFRDNAYFPAAIIEALGYSFDDVKNNRANYMLQLQSLVQSFNAIAIPNYIITFERAMQLGRNIYMDEDVVDSQIYLYATEGYYLYSDATSSCTYQQLNTGTGFTFQTLLDAIQKCINTLRASESYGNILGTIRRAFPDSALIRLDMPSTLEYITPVHDRNVTWQVNNAMFTEFPLSNLDITQSTVGNYLIAEPKLIVTLTPSGTPAAFWNAFYNSTSGLESKFVLNSYNNELGNEFAMEATRSMYVLDRLGLPDSGNSVTIPVKSCGTEIIRSVTIYTLRQNPANTTQLVLKATNVIGKYCYGITIKSNNFYEILNDLTKFNNHPRMWVGTYNPDTGAFSSTGFLGDLSSFTLITPDQLEYIHTAALQSAYLITVQDNKRV